MTALETILERERMTLDDLLALFESEGYPSVGENVHAGQSIEDATRYILGRAPRYDDNQGAFLQSLVNEIHYGRPDRATLGLEDFQKGAKTRLDDDGNPRRNIATCGHCGRSWDDGLSTGITPAPSGRCPFEYDHVYEDYEDDDE